METDEHTRWFHRDHFTPGWAEPPRLFLRWILGILIAGAAGAAGSFLMLVGAITTSGCFFSCSEPNYVVGIPALIGAGASTAILLGALWWAFADRGWRRAIPTLVWTGVLATVVLFLLSVNTG